jgi:hypothetical protein
MFSAPIAAPGDAEKSVRRREIGRSSISSFRQNHGPTISAGCGFHVPAHHHEPDRIAAHAHCPVPRLGVRVLSSVRQRAPHRSGEPLLPGCDAQRKDRLAVPVGYLGQGHDHGGLLRG